MKAHQLFMTAALSLVSVANTLGSDVKVIANHSVAIDSISKAELKRVFLLQTKKLKDGSPVEPVLQKRGAVHDAFFKQLINREGEEIRIYYDGMVFTGKATKPREVNSDADMVAYVARTQGAIGYVSSSANADGVKVLTIISENSNTKRMLLTRVEPDYPKELHQRGIEGVVRLSLTVSPKGSVESVRVLGGNPILVESAVKAAQRWIYSPAATTTTIEVSIPFEVRP